MPKKKQKNKQLKSQLEPNNDDKSIPRYIRFSFAYSLDRCVETENKNFFFTNKVPLEQIREYRATIDKYFHDWSVKTIQELEKQQVCYSVKKDEVNKVRNNIAKVFQKAEYSDEWIKQNIQDPDIYKFRITNQIWMFGIVKRNIVHVLLYDIWHLIDPDKDKNFSVPDNRTCTWCLKRCDGKQ